MHALSSLHSPHYTTKRHTDDTQQTNTRTQQTHVQQPATHNTTPDNPTDPRRAPLPGITPPSRLRRPAQGPPPPGRPEPEGQRSPGPPRRPAALGPPAPPRPHTPAPAAHRAPHEAPPPWANAAAGGARTRVPQTPPSLTKLRLMVAMMIPRASDSVRAPHLRQTWPARAEAAATSSMCTSSEASA